MDKAHIYPLMVLCIKGHLRIISLYHNNLQIEQKNHTNLHTKVPEHPLRDFCLLIASTLYAAILPDQTDILLPPLCSSKCNLINRSSCIHFFHLLMIIAIRMTSAIIDKIMRKQQILYHFRRVRNIVAYRYLNHL